MDILYERNEDMSGEEKATEKMSYRDIVMGAGARSNVCVEDFMEDGDVSDDNLIEEVDGESCFRIGMTNEEMLEARRSWRNSVIIKLVGISMGYHCLWRRFQVMWRTQMEQLLIDLLNEFFIVKLGRHEEFIRALSEGPWMIGELSPCPKTETKLYGGGGENYIHAYVGKVPNSPCRVLHRKMVA